MKETIYMKINIDFKSPRNLKINWQLFFVILISIIFCCFHLYTASFGLMQSINQRAIHLTFALVLGFCLYPSGKKSPLGYFTFLDIIFILCSIVSSFYLILNSEEIMWRIARPLRMDVIMGTILIIVVLEITRRTLGWALPI